MSERLIDIEDGLIKPLLAFLLKDKTTGENIIWATDTHSNFMDEKDILMHSEMIRPRAEKTSGEQKTRTKKKAEVFTPTWVCNRMNDNIDKSSKTKTWKEYVDLKVLEITCGEAPFLVSRYDTVTGKPISLKDRAGLLDRKLKAVSENAGTYDEWIEWAIRAFESSYGYEYQGDNLLIARINLLLTFIDYYKDRWEKKPVEKLLRQITNKIVWNIWQMDGLKDTVPLGKPYEEYKQLSLFDTDDIAGKRSEWEENKSVPCRIYDWRKGRSIIFMKLKEIYL